MRPVLFLIALSLIAMPARPQACTGSSTGKTALIDLVDGSYQGFPGGLYPGTGNAPPPLHLAAVLQRAASVVPRAPDGTPDPACGLIAVLSIGMSNTFHEFARFERNLDASTQRNPRLVLVNGAQGGKAAAIIANPSDAYWALVDNRIAALGLTPEQVQVVWLEELNVDPPDDFPLHAQQLRDDLETIVRHLHKTFPNLQICYLSDRSYGGYTATISPEPQAYETGFAVQWLIQDQVNGKPSLNFQPALGPVRAPALMWGPYVWADGTEANGNGTRWCACDFEGCGNVHPSAAGEAKVAGLLEAFFTQDVTAAPWFLRAPGEPGHVWRDAEADAHVVTGAQANVNFGADPHLLSDTNPRAYAFARFDLSDVTRPVLHAKLNFKNPEVHLSADQREVWLVPDSSWDEATITWNNAPALGTSLGIIPRATRDGTRSIDVTAAVNADPDGVVTFALSTTSLGEPASLVSSREGGDAPRLVMVPADSAPEVYCAAGLSASGCRARMSSTGIASASAPSGFVLAADDVEQDKAGIFFYGANGRQMKSWGNGSSFQCVVPPVRRGGLMPPAPPGPGPCSGAFALDLNARWCASCPRPNHNPGAGATVQAQLWYRDPQSTSNQTTSLSDALEFTVCP